MCKKKRRKKYDLAGNTPAQLAITASRGVNVGLEKKPTCVMLDKIGIDNLHRPTFFNGKRKKIYIQHFTYIQSI